MSADPTADPASVHGGSNVYRGNVHAPALTNTEITAGEAADERFIASAGAVLAAGADALRAAVPSHQSAVAVVVDHDWPTVHKYFSLSAKYAAWADYAVPARGVGLHDWLLDQPGTVVLTAAEFETHPAFAHFDHQSGHPPVRGWLAGPIRDRDGRSWGIAQLTDKIDGSEYTDADREPFDATLSLLSAALQALWDLRNASRSSPAG